MGPFRKHLRAKKDADTNPCPDDSDRLPAEALEDVTAGTPVPADDSRLDTGAGSVYVREVLQRYLMTVH